MEFGDTTVTDKKIEEGFFLKKKDREVAISEAVDNMYHGKIIVK